MIAEVEVNAVAEFVNTPVIVILADPPVNVPPPKEAAPETVMVWAPWMIAPVYPELTVMDVTPTATSMVQLPMSRPRPPPSKKTLSPATGTEAPPKLPELADQFNVLLQLPGRTPTQ